MTARSNEASGETRALADAAFGSRTHVADVSRPLAWLSSEELAIDLDDPAQRRFGDYELVEKIGEGGMGVVYRARQHGLERDVAIKLLAAGPWASDEFVARFRREARSAARMQHPNIVEIYEFGHRDGLNYFSMRLIEGRSLAEALNADGPLAPADAARLLRTLAEAMDYAHRLGVLHLDLKPANVLLTQAGEPLIADFGLARRIDAGHDGGGEISGTPSYMAPEQAQLESHPLTASTDLYGLGAILYECLTGRPPFVGGTAQATLERVIVEVPVAPRAIRRSIHADLEAICLRCLEKDPGKRYRTARDMAEDLGHFLADRPVSVRVPGVLERMQRWWATHKTEVAMFALLVAGIVGTTKEWRRAELQRDDAEEQRRLADFRAATSRGSAGLMAHLFPTSGSEFAALENPHEAAGEVIAWLDETMPGRRDEQLAILRDFMQSLVAAGKQDAADSLVFHVSLRLGADHYREVIRALVARGEPEDLQTAVLFAYGLDPASSLFEDTLRTAVSAHPDDADLLYFASLLCQDGGPPGAACVVPDAPERLATGEPDNAANWLLLAGRGTASPERMRELIAAAARAERYDDRLGRMWLLSRDGVHRSGVPLPESLAGLSLAVRPELDPVLGYGYLRAWSIPYAPLRPIVDACHPGRNPRMSPRDRADCAALAQVLVHSRGSEINLLVGTIMGMRLGRGTPVWDEMLQLRRQHRWSSGQRVGTSESDAESATGAAMSRYIDDLVNHGEFEANLRRLERAGVPRVPPPGWEPEAPETLLPVEDRAAFLAERARGTEDAAKP